MAPRNENKMQNKVLKKPKVRKAPEVKATELEEIDPINNLFQDKP